MIEVCVWRETDRSASAQHSPYLLPVCIWKEAGGTGNGKFKDLLRINKIPAFTRVRRMCERATEFDQ